MPVAFTYAVMGRCKKWLIALFGIIMVGIWFTAIYSGHHYMIDVLTGIACAVIGILLLSKSLCVCRFFVDLCSDILLISHNRS